MQIETTTAAAVTCHWDVRALIEPPSASQPSPPTLVIETKEQDHTDEPIYLWGKRRRRTKSPPDAQLAAAASDFKADQQPNHQAAGLQNPAGQRERQAEKEQTGVEEPYQQVTDEERDAFWDSWMPQCYGYGQREMTGQAAEKASQPLAVSMEETAPDRGISRFDEPQADYQSEGEPEPAEIPPWEGPLFEEEGPQHEEHPGEEGTGDLSPWAEPPVEEEPPHEEENEQQQAEEELSLQQILTKVTETSEQATKAASNERQAGWMEWVHQALDTTSMSRSRRPGHQKKPRTRRES